MRVAQLAVLPRNHRDAASEPADLFFVYFCEERRAILMRCSTFQKETQLPC
jgi:hypothetical protein